MPALKMRLLLALPLLACLGCAIGATSPGSDLAARLAAANLVAATAARAISIATAAPAMEPGNAVVRAILRTLDAAESGLDGAAIALRAGLPEVARSNLDAAGQQLSALQAWLPSPPTTWESVGRNRK